VLFDFSAPVGTGQKGVAIELRYEPKGVDPEVHMNLRNLKLKEVLDLVIEQTGTDYRIVTNKMLILNSTSY
jgi:hypothetical protein